jgi:hypothetical protein
VQEEEDQEPSEEDDAAAATRASPGRRPVRRPQRSCAPCTAPTHWHRPATAPGLSPFSPAGEHHCRHPFFFPLLPAMPMSPP